MCSAVLRRIVALAVVIGLIAQAVALVSHNGAMIEKAFAATVATDTGPGIATLEADLKSAICHSGIGNSPAASDDRTGGSPAGSGSTCPLCNGMACAYGLTSLDQAELRLPTRSLAIAFPPLDQRVTFQRLIRPPSRGPPAFV